MFDELLAAASSSADVVAVGAWARVENAACARRLSAAADVLERLYAADGSADREQWLIDNFAAVAAEIAPTQGVSLGVAGHQLEIAVALRDRLPKVNTVFLTGVITYRMVAAIEARTRLIRDPDALAAVDAAIADHLAGWIGLSVDKLHAEIDYWVDRFDPAAVRRAGSSARGRYVNVHDPKDGTGLASLEAYVFAQDGELIDARLDAMAAAVCEADPRTVEQRRADAMAAVFSGTLTLPCACGNPDCPAAGTAPSNVVVHVVAREDTLRDDSAVQMDGYLTFAQEEKSPPAGPSAASPGFVIGTGAVVPAPIVADKLATAKRIPVVHPGDAPPERRRIPTAVLAWFIRCRDLTCRFPGCAKPATHCDLDHTIPYPRGQTQASNLKWLRLSHESLVRNVLFLCRSA